MERLLLEAPGAARALFQIEAEDGEVRSFASPKVLIRAELLG